MENKLVHFAYAPVFNPINNGWIYLCTSQDGILWARSVAGKWAPIDYPVDFDTISADFDEFAKANIPATPEEMKIDNTDQIIDVPTAPDEPLP